MKLTISDNLRAILSRKFLDWAEILPEFGAGPIAELQRIRQSQRKRAKQVYDRTRPPDQTTVRLMYYRTFEFYQLHEYEEIQSEFTRFLPELNNLSNRRTYEDLQKLATMSGTSWLKLGTVAQKARLAGGIYHIDEKLPNKVDAIEFKIQKVLPSLIVVSFDVHLTETAAVKIARLQARQYLPEVRLFKLFPRSTHVPHEVRSAQFAMTRAVRDWVNDLQSEVEAYLRPITRGGFFSSALAESRANLPVIEVYAISGVPESEADFADWEREAEQWYQSLGFNFYPRRYKDNRCIYELAEGYSHFTPEDRRLKARYIALVEPFLRSLSSGSNSLHALEYRTKYVVNDAFGFIVILAFLEAARDNLRHYQRLVFKSFAARASLRKAIRINESIMHEDAILSVVAHEFNQWRDSLGRAHSDELDQLVYTGSKDDGEERNLLSDLNKFVDYGLEQHRKQLSIVRAAFSNYLALRNMEAIHRLQFIAAAAAAAAVLVAIILGAENSLSNLLDAALSLLD